MKEFERIDRSLQNKLADKKSPLTKYTYKKTSYKKTKGWNGGEIAS